MLTRSIYKRYTALIHLWTIRIRLRFGGGGGRRRGGSPPPSPDWGKKKPGGEPGLFYFYRT